MLSWEDFGGSLGIEVDLDDGFTFLSCFIMVSWEGFNSSSGMQADLDDIFTF